METRELILKASTMVRNSRLDICSIVNAKSGICDQDCKFCAQSSLYNTGVKRYPLLDEESILEKAKEAEKMGAVRFGIVTSGKRPTRDELLKIASIIEFLKVTTSLRICASLGTLEKDELSYLKDHGLDRYHHNLETSPGFFQNICTTHTFYDRVKTVENAKSIGLEVCSGGIFGVGESFEDRLELARILKDLEVDSVPINFLIPIKGTPFENFPELDVVERIKTIAAFRIVLGENVTIKIAAGREKLGDFQALAFFAGANGMIVGGYLTVKGRSYDDDRKLVEGLKELMGW
ncbi:biotin synthase [Thermotoga neapolitana DSM 4359]|jgi:biotin synthase|nr:biotin synthase [Thermotoga sp.]HBF11290.1 biotin synthase BioB [Thermotoga neapolitana]